MSNEKNKKQKYPWYKGRGIPMVIISFFLYFLYTILVGGSTNTVFPLIAEMHGWDISNILLALTFAGYVGSVGVVIHGKLVMKKGAKFVTVLCIVGTAILVSLWGIIPSLPLFIADLLVLRFFLVGFNTASNPALVGAWFPRTKGTVLGWATLGIVCSDLVWAPYIPKLVGRFGARNVFLIVGLCYIIFALIVVAVVKNTPEEAGSYPDGCAEGVEELAATAKEFANYKSPWTIKRVLTSKQAWQIILGFGLIWMATSMVLTQTVPRIVSLGYDKPVAILALQTAGVVALFANWFMGALNQKLGTKRAAIVEACWVVLMFLCGQFMGQSLFFVFLVPIGIMAIVGANHQLIVSMIITIWGRWDFPAVNRVVSSIQVVMQASAFAVVALFLKTPFGYNGMYVCCLVMGIIALLLIATTKLNFLGKKDNF